MTEHRGEILRLHAEGLSWKAIGRKFGRSADCVRANVDPEFALRRRTKVKELRQEKRELAATPSEHEPPPEVLADAVQRMKAELTLSQLLFGDPRPGQSALDRRRFDH